MIPVRLGEATALSKDERNTQARKRAGSGRARFYLRIEKREMTSSFNRPVLTFETIFSPNLDNSLIVSWAPYLLIKMSPEMLNLKFVAHLEM